MDESIPSFHYFLPKIFIPNSDIYLSYVASFLPEDVVTNEEFVKRSGLTTGANTRAQWIEGRTGIKSRHWVDSNQGVSDLAIESAKKLFNKMPSLKDSVRHLLLATISGDYPSPPTAPFIQDKLGLNGCATYDLGAACAGFTEGIQVAVALHQLNSEDVLLIAADVRSKFLNLQDYNTAPLFGDGAAAVLIGKRRPLDCGFKLKAIRSFTDGQHASMIMIPGGGSKPPLKENLEGQYYLTILDGTKIFIKAREAFSLGSKQFLSELDLKISDIKFLVPHQANSLIIREVKKDLGLLDEQVIETISFTGNTSGASVGIALNHMLETKKLNTGDLILLAAAGGGGIVSHALLEFTE